MKLFKTISVRIEGKGQFVDYIEHTSRGNDKFRVRIVLGGYKNQSFATLERWDGNEWKQVVYTRGEALHIDCNAGYRKLSFSDFAADRAVLVSLANEVL